VLQQLQRRANERSATNDIDTAPRVHTLGLAPATVASVAALREAGELSNQSLESLLDALIGAARDHGATAAPSPTAERDRVRATATTLGLLLVRDDAQAEKWIDQVLAANAKVADDVRSGKVAAAGRLVGEVMKLAAGKADAKSVRSMLLAKLGVKE
jgi:aspartyl-tRNA(Asn)/glutamyl-tRNA(Gln) amidotransferase subunit B